jgi:hypothetical protein
MAVSPREIEQQLPRGELDPALPFPRLSFPELEATLVLYLKAKTNPSSKFW